MNHESSAPAKKSPKDFFLYLIANAALYYCAVWLITLWWQYINRFFPAPGRNLYLYEEGWIPSIMRWAIASLIIVFPAYLVLARYLSRDLDAHPEKRELKTRKWLMYLAVSVAGVTIAGDLIALLYRFLEGNFLFSFFLKVCAVLVVAGLVFGYYLYELRRDGSTSSPQAAGRTAPRRGAFRWTAVALVAASLIGAFFVVGSPKTARLRNYDRTRVMDLQSIQWQIVNFWQQKERLPVALEELADPLSGFVLPRDPETDAGYDYQPLAQFSFELCARFSAERKDDSSAMAGRVPKPAEPFGEETFAYWNHGIGTTCFTRTIDPKKYPLFTKERAVPQ